MRARNIKPGFFKNENLAECSPLARLLFAGLWCLADREGRLEDRPKRIKAEILSYDTCDIDALLGELVNGGFIDRYEKHEHKVIQINAFRKHQYPHHKEIASVLPGKTETNPESPGLDQGETEFVPKATHLNPSSLNPSSLNPSKKPFPPFLDFPDFIAAWTEWIEYRKERRLPKLQERSIAHQFEEFEKWGKDAAIEAIRQSIRNNWQGIFAPKNGTPTNGQLKKPRCLTDEEIRTGTYNPLTGFTPARAQ